MSAFPTIDAAVGRRVLELVHGCTFDDFILSPQRSVLERRDPAVIDLSSRLSRRITLKRPIVSANMDTVTRAPMAIVQAEEGGIGIIDRGFRPGEIEPQVREVGIVKRTQHGVITDPWSIAPDASLDEAAGADGALARRHARRRGRAAGGSRGCSPSATCGSSTGAASRVSDRMTPVGRLVVHEGPLEPEAAERIMIERKVKKLPLVDGAGVLIGLITASDLLKHRRMPFATRDSRGRLRVGAAIGATGDYLERAAELIRADVDVLVIDIAHGHSVVMERAIAQFRKRFGDVEMIAGNVATAEGARFLLDAGADGVKVGHRSRRRLHHADDDELRRAAGAGARRVPAGGRPARTSPSSPTAGSSGTAAWSRRCCSAATARCSAAPSPAPRRRPARSCTSRSCCPSRRRR